MKNAEKIPIVSKKLLVPFILITSLFALWGFANDITNPMVSAFKKILELNNTQASWVQAAFYGGYFTMALPAAFVVKKYSYKVGILVGLVLYAVGALLFYPAAAMENYLFFLLALYILTFGLAFLETTANPFILSMGAKETATQRLNLAQAFNPLGALSGLFVAQVFILGALQSDDLDAGGNSVYDTLSETAKAAVKTSDLLVIRNPYVGLGLFVILMFVVIAFVKMPEVQKADEDDSNSSMWDSIRRIFKKERFVGGVIAQLFYVGAQIMCWTYIYQYAENLGINNQEAVNYAYAALVIFLISRFLFTYLMKFIQSGKLLMLLAVLAVIFCLGTIFIQGMGGLYSLVMVSFCMSLMFPTIYGIALTGLGDDAKPASAFLVMAIVGGAFMPVLQGLIMDIGGSAYDDVRIMGVPEVNFSFILPLVCFLVVAAYGYRAFKVYQIE
ncbi:L-fucose:H+ symporter permease [Aurantibacter crassamenti]|uniref:L-fucose:H+ symporter permease n=1 Tax=Aurantibacter crassamenti TaxID=1837375 RepID=UPI00193AC115|nr:L-fucose:H+ symporter permease [Aurantibacter crassamenti]MBM1105002.1 L-fucose:H+ symporter permease [Aurantibacter crassamenti]